MSTQPEHLHLLTPTVREADDAVGFDRPLNPYGLLLVAAMSGLVPAGIFLAHNAPRLGLKRWQWPTLILSLIAGAVIYWGMILGIIALINAESAWARNVAKMEVSIRLALRVGVFALIAWPQFHRYHLAPDQAIDKRMWGIVIVSAIVWAIVAPELLRPLLLGTLEIFLRPR